MLSVTEKIDGVSVRYEADTVEELVKLVNAFRENDSDGWIEWEGDEYGPVPDGTEVVVRFRDDEECHTSAADLLVWEHTGGAADIVAYKVVK